MKTLLSFFLILSGILPLSSAETDYDHLKAEAEGFYQARSYSKAHAAYEKAFSMELPATEKRWVAFRLADTAWRAQNGSETADSTIFEKSQHELEVLVRDIQRDEDKDLVWLEVQESLGDFWWLRRNSANWGQAWTYYQQALKNWGASKDLELARTRYLQIVWRAARPEWADSGYSYGSYGNQLPLEILENVLRIVRTDNDKARAHYMLAISIQNQGGDWELRSRVPEEFEAALKSGKATDWYDDALYQYATWMANQGYMVAIENGGWDIQPDFVKALELYRRILKEFKKGETRFYDDAGRQIEQITKSDIGVGTDSVFLPDSEIAFHLNWRNLKKVDLAIYKVDLTKDVNFNKSEDDPGSWLQKINLASREALRAWSKDTGDKGIHQPGQEQIRLEGRLPTGAYLVEAKSGQSKARDLILVTDASIVLKTSGRQGLVYFCNALDGSPLAGGHVVVWERFYNGSNYLWKQSAKDTNAEGLAVFDLDAKEGNEQLFVSAATNDRQAFAFGHGNSYSSEEARWKVFVSTDRPAYRPKEQVKWKFLARKYQNSQYSTPAETVIEYEVTDPQGAKVTEGKAKLNAFGSAWGSLDLAETFPLGEYRVTFWNVGRTETIGSANLFRLEEYKLPEFKVSVQTPQENGKKKAFRLGEKVEVNVQAEYYFGGPVANAAVELLVYQNAFYHSAPYAREFPWFYEDFGVRNYYGGNGSIIKRETLKTDGEGKTKIVFETPRNAGQNFEYRIEARVTDASRREITGSGNVRVTGQRYYVYPQPEHNIYRPQDNVKVELKALDANDQPVAAEGKVEVTRDYWYEIWIDPSGREIKGDDLRMLRDKGAAFPPSPAPGGKPWKLKFRGYEHDAVFTQTVKLDIEGKAEVNFKPERDGYYRVAWESPDKGAPAIHAETTVWVATHSTADLGFRSGSMQLILDKDTVRVGQKAPVMVVVPGNDRYVLLSLEGDDLYSYQLVHVTGSAKLVEIPIEEKHVPNFFLNAVMVYDQQIAMDSKQVVVPPVENFLKVDIKPDQSQYEPQKEGSFSVTTTDYNGKPVAAELSLGVVDESIYFIQQDYSSDPRQFFFGTKRNQQVQTQSTFNQKRYTKLIEDEEKQLVDAATTNAELDELGSDDKNGRLEKAQMGRERIGGYAPNKMLEGRMSTEQKKSRESFTIKVMMAPLSRMEDHNEKPGEATEPAVQVRTDFRATAFWQPDLVTDKDGKATVKVKYPDSLTSWRTTARVASAGNQFGTASASTRTRKPLICRLQAPRFFVVGDTVTVSAILNNNTDEKMTVRTTLGADGLKLQGLLTAGKLGVGESASVDVPANGEARVDWQISVENAGAAKLKLVARGTTHSDAMEADYVVHEHGIEKFVARSGKVRGKEITVKLDLPKERKEGSTSLMVQVAPSMAVTMLDALPYLIDYPYGCTEQTMSRFLPATITAKTLKDMGVDPETVMGKVFGGIEEATAGKTHPKGKKNLQALGEMQQAGLSRLYDFQHGDGGWGWWKAGESDHYMTAYVVWGLTLAQQSGLEIRKDVLVRGVDFLRKEIVEEENNHDMQAWMLHALGTYHGTIKALKSTPSEKKALENLWTQREKLNAYTRALLALAAHHYGDTVKAKTLVENLENGVKEDKTPDTSIVQEGAAESGEGVIGTAHWGSDGIYHRWSEGGIEATAFALRAILAIDPKNKLIEPVTNWLIKGRRGAQWSNTRDTAITVLALNDYLRVSGEIKANLEYELLVNGHSVAKRKISADDALGAPSRFTVDPKWIVNGANEVRLRRTDGKGALYFSAEATYFSLEEPITPAGNEIFVRRQYYKLVGHPTLLEGYVYDKLPLNDGESVTSGERVEVVLTIEAKNNYEYLIFEDLKPAGLEAVEIRSGEAVYAQELKAGAVDRKLEASKKAGPRDERRAGGKITSLRVPAPALGEDYTGRTRWVYQELRDRKVALFIDNLPEGIWEIRYDLRAEVPGAFHALPVLGHAMYVPEIRCNGSEVRVTVEDR